MANTFGNRKFLNRKLESRSFIDFEFPASKGNFPLTIRLPFFENIKISEKKAALLAKHNPLGRNSALFSWTGADARGFNVKFNITLPLLLEQAINVSRYIEFAASQSKEDKRLSFFSNVTGENSQGLNSADQLIREYIQILKDQNGLDYIVDFLANNKQLKGDEIDAILQEHNQADVLPSTAIIDGFRNLVDRAEGALTSLGGWVDSLIPFGSKQPKSPQIQTANQIIYVIAWWIQVIRASVINNATDPVLGPPVLRLNHGILYREVPTICSDFSITPDENGGYDVKTLLPRIITVSLNLMEVRAGNFERFVAGDPVRRDNIAGWEAIMTEGHTLDPQPIAVGVESTV